MADLAAHLVADVDGMWWPCGCGAERDHDHPDVLPVDKVRGAA